MVLGAGCPEAVDRRSPRTLRRRHVICDSLVVPDVRRFGLKFVFLSLALRVEVPLLPVNWTIEPIERDCSRNLRPVGVVGNALEVPDSGTVLPQRGDLGPADREEMAFRPWRVEAVDGVETAGISTEK